MIEKQSEPWKVLLCCVGVLIGAPLAFWLASHGAYIAAAIIGIAILVAVAMSVSLRRCPNCGNRMMTISFAASHCSKCGGSYVNARR